MDALGGGLNLGSAPRKRDLNALCMRCGALMPLLWGLCRWFRRRRRCCVSGCWRRLLMNGSTRVRDMNGCNMNTCWRELLCELFAVYHACAGSWGVGGMGGGQPQIRFPHRLFFGCCCLAGAALRWLLAGSYFFCSKDITSVFCKQICFDHGRNVL